MKEKLWWLQYRTSKWRHEWRDILSRKVAWKLPHRVVYWATIRAGANATTGKWENTVVPEVTYFEVLERNNPSETVCPKVFRKIYNAYNGEKNH